MKKFTAQSIWLVAGFAIFCFSTLFSDDAECSIININARYNTPANPIVEYLTAGTYDVTPIGVADGGLYNSWNAWGFVSLPSAGWLHRYDLSSIEFSAYSVGDFTLYSTDLLALSNADGTRFTLAADGNVNFFITDSVYYDNIGGVSLSVGAVPIPAPALLLCSGLFALLGLRKRIKR